MDARCSRCKQQLQAETVAETRGSSGGVHVTCLNVPYLACPEAHEAWLAHPDFFETLLDELLRRETIPRARRKGLFKKRWVCAKCGVELLEQEGQSSSTGIKLAMFLNRPGASYELEIECLHEDQGEAQEEAADYCFEVRIEAPACRCAICSSQYFLIPGGTLTSPLRHSLIAAMEEAGLGE